MQLPQYVAQTFPMRAGSGAFAEHQLADSHRLAGRHTQLPAKTRVDLSRAGLQVDLRRRESGRGSGDLYPRHLNVTWPQGEGAGEEIEELRHAARWDAISRLHRRLDKAQYEAHRAGGRLLHGRAYGLGHPDD